MRICHWIIRGAAAVSAALTVAGCDTTTSRDFLGSAVVEAKTYTVATTAQGSIVAVLRDEGQRVAKGDLIAVIDTVQLVLMKQEVLVSRSELGASIAAQNAQNSALASDVAGVDREFTRADQLVKKGSAPEQQRDNLGTQLQSSQMRLAASRHTITSLGAKGSGLAIKLQEIEDQIRRCYIRSPVNGVVLTRYRNVGEVAGPGNPFFEIGAFDTLYADFFVPQTMLASISLDQKVRIRLDDREPAAGSAKTMETFLPGTVSWIGSEAEFSPKNIQTRQSRNELVFRIRATIPNVNGKLKRGLPVEVWR
jgi:HlyD family secretion protein